MLNIGINGRSIFRQITGVQHYTREITRALCLMASDDVHFTVFSGREGRSRKTPDLPLSFSYFPAGGPLRGIIWEQALLKRMASKAGADVLFNPANMAPLNPAIPSVVTIHDLAFLLFPECFSRIFAEYYRLAIPRIARQAAAVITVSESTKAGLIEHLGLPEEKIHVVLSGVSPEFRRKIPRQALDEVRRRYNLPEKFFLSISSLEPRKNLKGLVHAYRLLPVEIRKEFGLVLTGTGGRIYSSPEISAEIAGIQDGEVVTTGYMPDKDLMAVYRLATTLVYPSLYEGFGLPVLEAMASSTPVIASNRSSLPEVAGSAAILIDPESIEEMAAAMELTARDSGTRNLLIERGNKRSAKFTWTAAAARTFDILMSAAR